MVSVFLKGGWFGARFYSLSKGYDCKHVGIQYCEEQEEQERAGPEHHQQQELLKTNILPGWLGEDL